ncbi:MAG: VWA domain-containing protein [Oscillospiraceae bacterium]|nr:VWA domain-containing protein [Oscillospiraceae bacterium]
MKKALLAKANEITKNNRIKRIWSKIARPLVIAAVFCTTYALILPAITMEGEPVCGFEEHFHTEACYEQVTVEEYICGLEENQEVLHEHSELCYQNDGTLGCTVQEIEIHTHSESCIKSETKELLVCTAEEHIHTENCYSSEEAETSYVCGMGVHSHGEGCFDGENLVCTIPEHEHEASCISEEVDIASDVETAEDWEKDFSEVDFTGNWAQDILSVAKTQIGYSESETNVVLENDVFKGYTRYGEKYGDPYGNWSGYFVSFCAEYAGINGFPIVENPEKWLLELDSVQELRPAAEFVPETGDIVFVDTDSDAETEILGIVSGKISGTTQIEIVAGDTKNNKVEYLVYDTADPVVLGFYELPGNPMVKEEINAASDVAAMIEELPSAEEAKTKLEEFNKVLDKESFDKYLVEHKEKIAAAREAHNALDDAQKAIAGDISVLDELETVLNEAEWKQLPALEEDKAFVSKLDAVTAENASVKNGETALLGFTAEITSYSEEKFGEARVKLEFVLGLPEEKAAFDLEAMAWLEEAVVVKETRTVDEEEKVFQVLTGYKRIKAANIEESAVPGTFTESAAVKIFDMSHGEKVSVQISAAMEKGTWEGTCETHGIAEKLTVESQIFSVSNPIGEGEQRAEYEALHKEYEDILIIEDSEARKAAADELWDKVAVKYLGGYISEEAFIDLSDKLSAIINEGEMVVAETSEGYNWKLLEQSGWFEEFQNAETMYAKSEVSSSFRTQLAFSSGTPQTLMAGENTSASQIRNEGGSNTSSEGAVYVSKTIEGTDIENVFDITLEVITQDIVTEVYKEPDMAVVIVMDISQTMNANFGNTTRYKAAMTAAENFIKQFRQNNKGASKIGFVAFNTDAHQIFALSQCSTAAQETSLIKSMRDKTGAIINASGYASAHNRFTNIEGGLKRAYDMLNAADNEHKYVVFLSDGFPTTYLNTGTSAAYDGYDPYDENGTRFYDSVQKLNGKNRPCAYGTSYSNEAAIRARKQATTMKNNGVTIFSIGAGIGDQTIKKYVDQCLNTSHAVVDRRNTNYEIGAADTSDAFKNWLGNKIGSGYYYDSTNASGLNSAFDSIFTEIKELNAQSSHLDWVATDPMGDMGVHEQDSVEFIGFYNKAGTLVEGSLKGESKDGAQYENTASFDTAEQTIYWDIKQSGYVSTVAGNITNYRCTLKYRVRLQNEMDQFVERQSYDTNDVTSLTYRVIEQVGTNVTISDRKTVDFPIPAVEGYLAELEFTKTNDVGDLLKGASFTLSHDTESCGFCRGDGKGHVSIPEKTAETDENSVVRFTEIPSGHTYLLTETKAPDGYKASKNVYRVTVAYDETTVTITAEDGSEVPWNGTVVNEILYLLPATGGSGTNSIYTLGAVLVAASAIMYGYSRRRKRREGAHY